MTFCASACFKMASTQELKEVIKETLENHGTIGQIKARIRAEVFNALDDHSEVKPPLSNENMIINELIREYLEFNQYKYSSSVLVADAVWSFLGVMALGNIVAGVSCTVSNTLVSQYHHESGQPKEPLNREFLSRELNIREDRNSSSVPLLYSIVSHYLKDNKGPSNRGVSPQRTQANSRGIFHDHLDREIGTADTEQAFVVMGGRR